MSDDMVIFQVEETLFKVHTRFLWRHSHVFRDIISNIQPISVPNPKGSNKAGTPDEKRVVLEDVTVLQFESLLEFFYSSMLEDFSLPVRSWVAILSIAHRYQLHDAEVRAIREVFTHDPPLGPVEQMHIAEQFEVPWRFLAPALHAVVVRAEPFNAASSGKSRAKRWPRSAEPESGISASPARYLGRVPHV
ncbi:hypothetical protein BV25DRAFT_794354 [Artomyces pyxidatus]|uniref:Uncharacterized protein n=1 Tax=Artomyces pyxidatus TaxID=48021 RepID=A0ACB8SY90_9AGAM|nr:hypothetical protein BV25DRAFT_794354 [Artomyces pyxidatus]